MIVWMTEGFKDMREYNQDEQQQNNAIDAYECFLKPGYIMVNSEDSVVRTVLGNSVSVTIFDREHRFGGMNHFIFPITKNRAESTPQFGNVSVTALCRMMFDLGGNSRTLEAQIMGGAENGDINDRKLGRKNVEIARKMLKRFNIPVVSEDVGGTRGRKIIYHTGTNETIIYKVNKIRESDWFEIGQDLRFA